MTELFLGLDGGGTGCRAAIASADGLILGRGTGGAANINSDLNGAADSIMQAVTGALAGLDVAPDRLTATLGLAGGAMREAAARLAEMLPLGRIQIVNDAVTAARGAIGDQDGILAAIGTGSVFAIQRAGQLRQVGGRGFLMGDEGSGAVLGRAALVQAMRAGDGMTAMTPLLSDLLREFGGHQGIIAFGNRARPADFAALAPRLIGSDDAAARAIMADATQDVRHIIATLQGGAALPVTFIGGLGPAYAARLADAWPQRPAQGDGVDGALLMARQMGLVPTVPDR